MISAHGLSELLAALHSAPLEEANWQVFLANLCQTTIAAHGACIAIDVKRNHPAILAVGGVEYVPEVQDVYNRHYGGLDPYAQPFLKSRNGVVSGEELVRRNELEKTEFYNDFLLPNGLHHAAMIPGAVTPSRLELVSVWRGPEHGPFDRDDRQLFDLLLPHLQSAMQVRHVLSISRARAMRTEAALDTLPTACFILSTSGRIVHMNQAAESLARLRDGIEVSQDHLAAIDPAAQTKLRATIASAAAASGASLSVPCGAVVLPRISGKRPQHAMVLPLRLPVAVLPAHVLVLVGDPEASVNFPDCVLSALYGFTRSEIEIANGLLAGLSIEEIADLRSVTTGTLRMQMKSIFQKTGVRRQSELVRLLMSLPRPAPDDN